MKMFIQSEKWLMFVFVGILAASCSSNSNPVETNWAGHDVVLINQTSKTVYFTAFEQEILAFIDWLPSTNPNYTNRIEPPKSGGFNLSDVPNYQKGKNVVLFYWNLGTMADSTYKVENFRNVVIYKNQLERLPFIYIIRR